MHTDLFVGWDDSSLEKVEREMKAYRALRHLDMTFEVLGHLVKPGGAVIGIVTEPAIGRSVEYKDLALVYEAASRLQQNSMIFPGLSYWNHTIIHQGKLRLVDLTAIRYYTQDETAALKADAERFHWNSIERSFDLMKSFPGQRPSVRDFGQRLTLLPGLPTPARPLLLRLDILSIPSIDDALDRVSRDKRSSKLGRSRRREPLLLHSSEHTLELSSLSTSDSPRSVQGLRHSQVRVQLPQYHPYYQGMKSRKMILGSDQSDRTSDSGESF